MTITYRTENDLDAAQFIECLRASTLGEQRPVDDVARIEAMLRHANLIVTARKGELLVGVARALSDFSFITYLSDLAVRASHQKQGIGRELMRQVQREGGLDAKLLLLAAPAAQSYYRRVGFSHHPQAWILNPDEQIK